MRSACLRWLVCLVGYWAGATWVWAQTHVVLYGIVDTGMGLNIVSSRDFISARDAQTIQNIPVNYASRQFGMSSGAQSGSRWGLRITEQLDPQNKIIAVLEQGVFSNTGTLAQNGIAFGRQSTLGLENTRFGRVDLGMQTNIASNYFLDIDPFALGFGQANMGASFGAADTFRLANMVLYQTPIKNNWQFGLGYSFNAGVSAVYLNSSNPAIQPASQYVSNQDNLRALTTGFKYQTDQLTVVGSFDLAIPPANIPQGLTPQPLVPNANSKNLTQWILGVKFKTQRASAVAWSFAVGQMFNGSFSGQTPGNNFAYTGLPTNTFGAQILFASGYNLRSYLAGATWQLNSNQTLMASWQIMQPTLNIPTIAPLSTAHTWSMAYTYGLSKRTNLYTWVSKANNFQMFSGSSSTEIGVGLRHLF